MACLALLVSYKLIYIYVDTHCVLFDSADISALAEAEDRGCGLWAETLLQYTKEHWGQKLRASLNKI